ncbi:MAG: hypothetical protein UR96_C0018G0006 [candidate division WS6 bacterium GW2011_GWC1_36_11]|uniref:Uncharacterized protein n=2 Tax=Candidatus Dojkabacteria TaxID=74243 RepID=A0A0G0FY69_9BACT|nr:MAG: hypothetical protein UR96_C0018G0006 [candidate division WS6 bacterium GW2011_GWC1_36_11]HAM96358.1 hypothetical protein [Patescibacteria group bacterium]
MIDNVLTSWNILEIIAKLSRRKIDLLRVEYRNSNIVRSRIAFLGDREIRPRFVPAVEKNTKDLLYNVNDDTFIMNSSSKESQEFNALLFCVFYLTMEPAFLKHIVIVHQNQEAQERAKIEDNKIAGIEFDEFSTCKIETFSFSHLISEIPGIQVRLGGLPNVKDSLTNVLAIFANLFPDIQITSNVDNLYSAGFVEWNESGGRILLTFEEIPKT